MEEFGGLTLNENHDAEVSGLFLDGLNISSDTYGKEDVLMAEQDSDVAIEVDQDSNSQCSISDMEVDSQGELPLKTPMEESQVLTNQDTFSVIQGLVNVLQTVSQGIVSPTQLGLEIARWSSLEKTNALENTEMPSQKEPGDENKEIENDNSLLQKVSKLQSKVSVLSDTTPVLSDALPALPEKRQTPGNLSLHNHYHYYYCGNHENRVHDLNCSAPDSLNKQHLIEDAKLPSPWSKIKGAKYSVPYLISTYLQLFFNLFTFAGILYAGLVTFRLLRADVVRKLHENSTEIMLEASVCAKNYRLNNCDPEKVVPAMEKQCFQWEKCMRKNPKMSAIHASLGAETIGTIFNSLIEPIGIKALIFFFAALSLWLFSSNLAFGFIRGKSYYKTDYK